MNTRPVLIVENNPDDQMLALRAFWKSRLFYTIIVAKDGVEALDYLLGTGQYAGSEPPMLPVVVLLDFKIPRKDGLEVLQEIRRHVRTMRLPVVILTSSKHDEDLLTNSRLGVNSVARKPVDFADFLAAIEHFGLHWLIINEGPIETNGL